MTARGAARLARAQAAIGDSPPYDFYRCCHCYRLIPQPQLVRALEQRDSAAVCPCGAVKFKASNPLWWEYLLPRVVAFAWERARELGVAGLWTNLKADWRTRRTKAA